MGTFENSIMLAKASWKVLRDDKQLALLPLLSMLTSLLVLGVFLLPIAVIAHDGGTGGGTWTAKPLDWVLGVHRLSSSLTYVVVFFNAALVCAADRRLRRRRRHASARRSTRPPPRAHVLLPWALVSATVSLVLRALEQRVGIVGRIVGALVGVAWSLVTFLVLPILVVEGIGPIAGGEAVPAELFKRTWGEKVVIERRHRHRRLLAMHRRRDSGSCSSS